MKKKKEQVALSSDDTSFPNAKQIMAENKAEFSDFN